MRRELKLTESDPPVDYFAELQFDGRRSRCATKINARARWPRVATARSVKVTENARTIKNVPLRLRAARRCSKCVARR